MTLVAFDFDGTLADSEMMDRLAARHGVGDEVAGITERAMRGELSYAESLRERASLVGGLSAADAADVYGDVRLRDGAGELLAKLSEDGVRVVVLTGGFGPGVEAALDAAGASVDRVVANSLPEADGVLTGDVEGPLIEGTKDDALAEVCAEYGVDVADSVAVGDGANDAPMLDEAGCGVGFQPKPGVEEHCDVVVESMAELEALLRERRILG
ncbi:phosphoserine phosphatase SerB [Halobacterium sp. CBA1126]|uniref:phosphoserine phosphatase SerB n=1 Tax=Halobacterium sp. CBA1126 TaxID=2668074 RepID=UPI0012F93985|nr:phosphoserine phosphatase SerB [Halobacterium sp. CBA1126]MUV59925.1 phosphoserine phosphatase SerB [Halobacterium sp. CBA1126]